MIRSAIDLSLLLLILSALFVSCASGYTEFRAEFGELDELAELPVIGSDMELLFDGECGGERVLEIRSDVSERLKYESRLDYLWYASIPPQPETEDRVSTFIHPTGWRAAIYDNRRNSDLMKKYGTEEYVWQVRIAKIEVNDGIFPRYPLKGRALVIDGRIFGEYDSPPSDVLPENFPDLPEHSKLIYVSIDESGLHFAFITTYQGYESFIGNALLTYEPCGACFADARNDYFYSDPGHITVVTDREVSAKALSEPERTRLVYTPEELPQQYDENGKTVDPDPNAFVKVTVLFVRAEWVPKWWEFS